MNRLNSLWLGLLLSVTVSGQTLSQEFGKVGKDDLDLNSVSFDTDAEAVVMFDYGDSRFVQSETGFDVLFERQTRVKVLTEAGAKFAEFEIPFYQDRGIFEKIFELEAVTYNFENGRLTKTPLDLSTVYTEKINEFWSLKKFAMPGVKPGSIVEYRYKLQSEYVFNLRDWEFQWKIPVLYSQYTVHVNPFYYYVFRLQGASKADVYERYEDHANRHPLPFANVVGSDTFVDVVYKFGMKNVQAFRDEEYISSVNDYIMKLDFQLAQVNMYNGVKRQIMTTWEELVKELDKHENFGRLVSKSEKAAAKLLNLQELQTLGEEERLNRIIDYVKTNYSWDGESNKYSSKTLDQLLKEKTGNSADLNLFATGLLAAAGIEAVPLISSTRNHGAVQVDHPFATAFNYTLILATVNGRMLLTDATEPLLLNNRIPERCINNKGLTVCPDNIRWIGLEGKVPSYYNSEFRVEVEAGGLAKVFSKHSSTEYEGFYYRNLLGNNKQKIEKQYTIGSFDFDPASVTIENLDERQKPFVVSFEQQGRLETINRRIYINPFLGQNMHDNPLKQKVRTYPVDLIYPKMRSFKTEIVIPEGYEVTYTPEDKSESNDLFNLYYQVYRKDDGNLMVTFSYLFKSAVYAPDVYPQLKSLFATIMKCGNEQIVLSPTNSSESSAVVPVSDNSD